MKDPCHLCGEVETQHVRWSDCIKSLCAQLDEARALQTRYFEERNHYRAKHHQFVHGEHLAERQRDIAVEALREIRDRNLSWMAGQYAEELIALAREALAAIEQVKP